MNGEQILRIAESWSFWDRPVPETVPRRVALPEALHGSLCLVVQGVRRCGKSTLLRQLIQRYRLPPKHCAFLNLEDPRLSNALDHSVLEALVTGFRARHATADRLCFFLDEIQNVDGWERWLRAHLDRGDRGNVFVITGSNAHLLSGELGSVLTGRHLTVELYPFDLEEAAALDPRTTLVSYLQRGGFPEPMRIADGEMLLRQYFDDIVERDVRERLRARSSRPIRQVVQMVYESAGSEMSLRRVAAAAGIAVETAAGYLEACEAAYLLFGVPFFAFSERRRAHRNRKFYPIDPGLRRVAATRTGDDLGKSLECAALIALRRRFRDVSYWRGSTGEVDFVVHDGSRIVPVQVTWKGEEPRHTKALELFYEHFPQAAEALFVTAETFPTLEHLL